MSSHSDDPFLNYIDRGTGMPVILIHGLACSMLDWDVLIPELNQAGYRTLAVDMFGHGDSPKPKNSKLYNFRVVYGTLEEWIDSLNLDPPFFMIGHSMGGYMTLKYAQRFPSRVSAMVLIDPLVSLKQLPSFMINTHRLSAIGSAMLNYVPEGVVNFTLGHGPTYNQDFTPSIRNRIAADVKRASPFILNIPSTLPDLTNELENISTPCELIWGDKDPLLDPGSFPAIVSAMPFAVGHVLPGRGHQPHLAFPKRVNQLILEFLEMNQLPKAQLEALIREKDAQMAWRLLMFEKYQTIGEVPSPVEGVLKEAVVAPILPPARRNSQAKKEELLAIAENFIIQALDWGEKHPTPEITQIEDLALNIGNRLGYEVIKTLYEDSTRPVSSPACTNCGSIMDYYGESVMPLDSRLGVIEVIAEKYRCRVCSEEVVTGKPD